MDLSDASNTVNNITTWLSNVMIGFSKWINDLSFYKKILLLLIIFGISVVWSLYGTYKRKYKGR